MRPVLQVGTYGFAGPGSWGNQYSVPGKKPDEFSSLQLIVPDTKDAADGTDKFLITAGFGQLMQPGYTEHTINTGAALFGGNTDQVKTRRELSPLFVYTLGALETCTGRSRAQPGVDHQLFSTIFDNSCCA